MNKLVQGLIPAKTPCPFKERCGLIKSCHHRGENHQVAFSCGCARALNLTGEVERGPGR